MALVKYRTNCDYDDYFSFDYLITVLVKLQTEHLLSLSPAAVLHGEPG